MCCNEWIKTSRSSTTTTTTSTTHSDGNNSSSTSPLNDDAAVDSLLTKQQPLFGDGIERRQRLIEAGLLFLSVLYGTVHWLNPPSIVAAPHYCNNENNDNNNDNNNNNDSNSTLPCHRPDLLAYKVTSFVAMVIMGSMGFYHWYCNPAYQQQQPQKSSSSSSSSSSPEEQRLLGYWEAAEYQNVAILCYQIWDLVVSLSIPEHCQPIFLLHHVLAGLVAYWSLRYQLFGYYSIYYGGCSELSSIFLVWTDVTDMFPMVGSSSSSTTTTTAAMVVGSIVQVSKVLFVITFIYYRVIGWIFQVGIPLWKDTWHVQTTLAMKKSSSTTTITTKSSNVQWLLSTFLGLSVVLGALQVYWFVEILHNVQQALVPFAEQN
jgi:hypothetical protein